MSNITHKTTNNKHRFETLFKSVRFLLFTVTVPFLLFSCDNNPIKSMRFGSSALYLSVGQQDTVELFIEPLKAANYNLIRWSSSDNGVARVSQNGIITAIYTGTCIITASYLDVKAQVEVTVAPISISLDFAKAAVYYFGDVGNHNTNRFIIRLLSDGYSIEPNGNIVGAGYYLNMEMNTERSVTGVPVGTFKASHSNTEPHTYTKGNIVEQNGSRYATGSYVGFVSIGGSSVILIDDGDFNIVDNGTVYKADALFKGSRRETVQIDYAGDILFFDRSQPTGDTLNFTSQISNIELLGDAYGIGKNIFRVRYADNNGNILQLDMVAPISATTLPVGIYRLNGLLDVFMLAPSDIINVKGTLLIKNGVPTEVIYGSVRVSKNDNNDFQIKISLVGANNEVINR